MLKLGANLRWLFQEWPLAERFAMAASVGFTGIELPSPYETPARDMARILDDNGLGMVQIATPADWANGVLGLMAVPGRSDDFMKAVHVAVDYAAQIGRPAIHVLAGAAPTGMDRRQMMDLVVANMTKAAEAADAEGVTLTVEPVCSARDPNWVFHRLSEGRELIAAVGRPNLKLVFDTFHVGMEEGALIENLTANFDQIGAIQLGNPPDRHEPGVGDFDLLAFMQAAVDLGWKGWISGEYVSSRGTLGSLDWARPFNVRPTPEAEASLRKVSGSSADAGRNWREMNRQGS